LRSKGEGETFAHGVCIIADKKGDTYVTYNTLNSNENGKSITTYVKGGTGKFKNLTGTGTASELMPAHTKKKETAACNPGN
jgi:hypothetical protein